MQVVQKISPQVWWTKNVFKLNFVAVYVFD